MTLKQYLIFMSLATGICSLTWFFVIFKIDPASGGVGLFFFYVSFFLTIIGIYSTVGFALHRLIDKIDGVAFRHVKRAFRQGAVVAIFLTGALFLQQKIYLNWLTGISLIILFIVIEGLIFANRKFNNRDYV